MVPHLTEAGDGPVALLLRLIPTLPQLLGYFASLSATACFQAATGQLENHGRLRAVKKDIARIYTVLRERELGIRAEVAAPVVEAKEEKKSKKAATKKADKAELPKADLKADNTKKASSSKIADLQKSATATGESTANNPRQSGMQMCPSPTCEL